jgi:hypothetical protein
MNIVVLLPFDFAVIHISVVKRGPKPVLPSISVDVSSFVIFVNQMLGSWQSVKQKTLKDANLSLYAYVYKCMYVLYESAKADVPKLSWVHIGCVRPKINNAAVVYWQLNV